MSLEEQVAEFVKEYLPDNPKEWCERYAGKGKIIHDALWGTFKLRPSEVALLDTPLLQRLRFLHQTGAVYLTYPSAHHTRFEHSLGVLCQTVRLVNALNESSKDTDHGEVPIGTESEANVRFAALLHDTGHGPFSHTSEQYFANMPDMVDFKKNNTNYEKSGEGEILSALIVRSEPFQEFVMRLRTDLGAHLNTEQIAGIITGTLGPEELYLTEIVHGPFDADKLDYMHRDGLFSGLKMHVDVDRLHHSIFVKTHENNNVVQRRMCGKQSGLSPMMQILFNKMLLFTGMYHHHKVRAVDCMLWAIFELAREKKSRIAGRYLEDTPSFLFMSDDRLLIEELADDEEIKSIIRSIRKRELWKKCLVIARNTVPQEMHDSKTQAEKAQLGGITNLAGNEPIKIQRRRELADTIWKTAGEPCKRLEVWLDVPKSPGVSEAKKLWVGSTEKTEEPKNLESFIPIKEWVELYGTHQKRSFVFAPPNAGKAIARAAVKVFEEEFGLQVLDHAYCYS